MNEVSKKNSNTLVGIDLGTCTLEAAVISPDSRAVPIDLGTGYQIPSVVYFNEDGTVEIGDEAEARARIYGQPTVLAWKRHMGTDEVLYEDKSGNKYYAKDVAIHLIKFVKEAAEQQTGLLINNVVITTPANYPDRAKLETIDAAGAAGFTNPLFEKGNALLGHEPSMAVISKVASGVKFVMSDGAKMVMDIGGGTSDFSIVMTQGNKHSVLKSKGIRQCGGLDCTFALIDYCAEKFEEKTGQKFDIDRNSEQFYELYNHVELKKRQSNTKDKVTVIVSCNDVKEPITLTKDEIRSVIKPLVDTILEKITETIKEAGIERSEIIEAIPIGGGSMFFPILEALEDYFGGVSTHSDPILAVAKGAALFGWKELGAVTTAEGLLLPSPNYVFRDVTTHDIGVMALTANGEETFGVILESGRPMPSSFCRSFQVSEPGATDVLVSIRQGHAGDSIKDTTELGSFELIDVPPVFDKPHQIDVEFSIDKNGILSAIATDTIGGKTAQLEVSYNSSNQSAAA